MGCACSDRSYIEENINDMWRNTLLVDLKSSDFIILFEKATAYKKDLRTKENFEKILLDHLLTKRTDISHELKYLKDTYLNISTENSFEIPFVLLFLTKSKDHVELHNQFDKLFTMIDGRMDNPKKLKKNLSSLKSIMELYICMISLYSIQSYSFHSGNDNTKVIDQFCKIYSVDYIKRHLERIFNFEKNARLAPNQENAENVDVIVKEMIERSELLEFFKYNFDRFDPIYIRNCLYDYERDGLNSDEEIRKYQEKLMSEDNNLVSAPRKTKTIVKKSTRKKE